MNLLTAIALSIQLFTVTSHQDGMAQSISESGVTYQLDPHYEVGDTVFVIYDNDDIIYELKLDLY